MRPDTTPAFSETLEDSLLHAAFGEVLLQEWDDVAAQEPTAEEAALLEHVQADMPRQLEEIRRKVRQHHRHTRRPPRVTTALHCAIVLLLLILTLNIALAAKCVLGASSAQLLVTLENDHVNISLVSPHGNQPDPPPWYQGHYPTYLPEEFTLFEELHHTDSHVYSFFNKQGEWLCFKTCSSGCVTGLSMNSGTSKTIQIHGTSGVLLHTDREFIATWFHDKAYFVVVAPTEELALRVARSVRPGVR